MENETTTLATLEAKLEKLLTEIKEIVTENGDTIGELIEKLDDLNLDISGEGYRSLTSDYDD